MSKAPAKQTLTLGPVEVTTGSETPTRAAILLWGAAGCGKTTFAATAPGKKIWCSFGDNEHVSVMHRKDVMVANYSNLSVPDLFKHAQNDNPFGLDQFLAEHDDVGTVVVDSITAIAFRALQKAVMDKVGAGKGFTPTLEVPGISAYGARNAIVLEVMTGLLRVTAKHGVHVIFTAHEADPVTRKEGQNDVIDYIGIMLGGQLVNNTSWRLSEIWYMSRAETGEKHQRIAIRPTRLRKPMKTRMFTSKDKPEFDINYDADTPDDKQKGMTISSWIDKWIDEGGAKQSLPTFKK